GYALEPPVAEELGVVGRDDQPRRSAGLAELPQTRGDQVDEVLGMADRLLLGRDRTVGLLGAEVDVGAGHPPVLQARAGVLSVELAVEEVARVAPRRRPDLHPG